VNDVGISAIATSAASSSTASTLRAPFSPYLLSLLYPASVVAGNLLGGWYAGMGIILAFVIYPICDVAFGKDDKSPQLPLSPLLANGLILTQALLHFVAVTTLLLLVRSEASNLFILLAVVSTGVNSGLSMIVIAHELIHRESRVQRGLGLVLLWTVSYLHFHIEHNRRHHHLYSNAGDPATASMRESYWDHLPKTVVLQYLDAWRCDSEGGNSGLRNRVLHHSILILATWLVIWQVLGPASLVVWLLQGLCGIAALEYANFIFHWGLDHDSESDLDPDSWQILNRWSRWVTLRHTYHPDHHLNAGKRCYELSAHATSPTLPSGFFGCLYLAGLPPLWLAVMQDRLPLNSIGSSVVVGTDGMVA